MESFILETDWSPTDEFWILPRPLLQFVREP